MANGADSRIGIDHLEFYLPPSSHPVREYLEIEPDEFSLKTLKVIWKDTAIEPEILFRYFSDQVSGANNSFAPPDMEELSELEQKSGINRFYRATDENSSDMAIKAGRQILAREPDLAKHIDAVICYHSTINEAASWSIACRLQHELCLRNAFAFSISQKSGNASLVALKVACDMLNAEPDLDTLLLVGAEKLVLPYRRVFGKMTIIGDSASAMIVRRNSRQCRPCGFKLRDFPDWWNAYTYNSDQLKHLIEFLSEEAALLLDEVLAELNAGWDRVALLIPPNFSLALVRQLGLRTQLSFDKIYSDNISRFGYLLTSDLAVNLSTALSEGRVNKGDLVLVLNLGLGLSLGCMALEV